MYDLFEVIIRFVRLEFGHYTALARKWDETSLSTVWTFDDSNTRRIEESEAISEIAVCRVFH